MGLDMMLYGLKKDKKEDIFEPSSGVWEEVCYWRKANQIHKWFSDNFIKKQDPWGFYEVDEESLQGLLVLCKFLLYIKENPDDKNFVPVMTEWFSKIEKNIDEWEVDIADTLANVILPPDNIGCFFGSGVVDDWYWDSIKNTVDQLSKTLEQGYYKYFYMASW